MRRPSSSALLLACGAALVASWLIARRLHAEPVLQPDADATLLTCDDAAARVTDVGVVINNSWNRASAGTGPWRQCLQSRQREGRVEYGWFWHWPARDGIYAYPERLIGRSPWNGVPSNDPRFPARLAAIGSMRIDYDVESRHQGKKNLAAEFWLTDPASRDIHAEVMVWTEESPGMATDSPADEVVTIEGRRWSVRMRPDWGDMSGGSRHTWSFITYRAVDGRGGIARYDARRILQHAIDRGWVDPRDQVEGVELGNEIVSGSGSTWVRHLTVTID